jgi:non-ribosomal peptide synthetase component F
MYYNCCGPTETTIVNTMQRHTAGQPLSIGRPTPNNRVYILDESLNQVKIGQSGTIWAGGKGISRGYVGLPELTQQRYLPDKFANDGYVTWNLCASNTRFANLREGQKCITPAIWDSGIPMAPSISMDAVMIRLRSR